MKFDHTNGMIKVTPVLSLVSFVLKGEREKGHFVMKFDHANGMVKVTPILSLVSFLLKGGGFILHGHVHVAPVRSMKVDH